MLTRQEKRSYRQQMLQLVGMRTIDKLPAEELQEVQRLGQLIGASKMDQSKPLPKLDLETFTWMLYLELLEQEYSVQAIQDALGVSKGCWRKWCIENNPDDEAGGVSGRGEINRRDTGAVKGK